MFFPIFSYPLLASDRPPVEGTRSLGGHSFCFQGLPGNPPHFLLSPAALRTSELPLNLMQISGEQSPSHLSHAPLLGSPPRSVYLESRYLQVQMGALRRPHPSKEKKRVQATGRGAPLPAHYPRPPVQGLSGTQPREHPSPALALRGTWCAHNSPPPVSSPHPL